MPTRTIAIVSAITLPPSPLRMPSSTAAAARSGTVSLARVHITPAPMPPVTHHFCGRTADEISRHPWRRFSRSIESWSAAAESGGSCSASTLTFTPGVPDAGRVRGGSRRYQRPAEGLSGNGRDAEELAQHLGHGGLHRRVVGLAHDRADALAAG